MFAVLNNVKRAVLNDVREIFHNHYTCNMPNYKPLRSIFVSN